MSSTWATVGPFVGDAVGVELTTTRVVGDFVLGGGAMADRFPLQIL
jgi:hypothetical protein